MNNNPTPKIIIEGYDIKDTEQNIRVLCNGVQLVTAYDMDYEDHAAEKCCELLAAMHKAGLITLEANDAAKEQWPKHLVNAGLHPDFINVDGSAPLLPNDSPKPSSGLRA